MIHPGDITSPTLMGRPLSFFIGFQYWHWLTWMSVLPHTELGSRVNGRMDGWKESWGVRQTRRQMHSFLPSVSLRLAWVPVVEATSWHVRLLNYLMWRTRAPVANRASCILDGNWLRPAGQSHSQRIGLAGAGCAPGPQHCCSFAFFLSRWKNAPRPPPVSPVLMGTYSSGDSPERSPPGGKSLPFAGGEVGGEGDGWSSGRSSGRMSGGKSQAPGQSSAAAGAEREWQRRRRRRPWSSGSSGDRHASWRGFLASCFKGAARLSPQPLHAPGRRGQESATMVPGPRERKCENSGRP